jgi:hypothetical protein
MGIDMRRTLRCGLAVAISWAATWLGTTVAAAAETAPYPAMASLGQYRIADRADEVALARSAAPPSISVDATVLALGASGYETAAAGKNGFVCIVERSWAAGFDDAEFWNPKVRAPICFNAQSAKAVLPAYLERTAWALAGVDKAQMLKRTQDEAAAGAVPTPPDGAMCFMMSRQGYLSDRDKHWHPHLMFYVAGAGAAAWGANLPGSPVMGGKGPLEPFTLFMIPVPKWSDGTAEAMAM